MKSKIADNNLISAIINKKKMRNIASVIIITIIVALIFVYMRYEWNRYYNNASDEAIMLAQSTESLLHTEHIIILSGSEDDVNSPEYNLIKNSLIRLVKTNTSVRFAYLMREQNGDIIILVDSESPVSPDYSPPGQVFKEAEGIYKKPFLTGEPVLTLPTTDRWGTWISALVPIKDPSNSSVIAVLGIDYPAYEWYLNIWKQMIPDVFIIISIILLLLSLFRIILQHYKLKDISKKLARDEALYHSIFNQAPIGIAIVQDKNFVAQSEFGDANINPACEKILGRNGDELSKISWPDITHPDDLKEDLEKFEMFKMGLINIYSMEKRFIKPDGLSVWTNMHISNLLNGSDLKSAHLCLLEDITVRKDAEKALMESERSKSVLLSHLPGMAYRCKYDREWTMLFVSDGCYELTGYRSKSFINNRDLSFDDVITPEYRELLSNEWKRILPQRLPFKYEYEITTAGGEQKWVLELGQGIYDENGNVEALEGIILDISDRKEIENRLRFYNDHDSLTGLYRRNYLEHLLEIDNNSDSSKKRALIGINFSTIHSLNITYGFQYTQDLMKKIADTLKQYCDRNRVLIRTYESQFAFYLKDYEDTAELSEFCDTLASELMSMLSLERIGGGIGVYEIVHYDTFDSNEIIKKLLIVSEKAIDKNGFNIGICFYDKDIERQISREEDIKYELKQIAENDDRGLYLQYQPIFDLKLNQICGFEALARIKTERLGRVTPLEFIPLTEETKLIIPIGEKIMRKAFAFSNKLKDSGYDHIGISVNVSVIQLLKHNFTSDLFNIINELNVNPENISIEITESVLAFDYDIINKIISELKFHGIKTAIDDFGTGYSSLARERELDINCLKIDKHFIDKLLIINPENAITGDIISMAHKLGHCVVAEGVEHEKQMEFLKNNGCDKIQGYLIGKPLDEDAAIEILSKQITLKDHREQGNTYSSGLQPETSKDYYTKEQLKLILDSTAEAIYGIDLEGKCTYCNESCINLLGYKSDKELLGQVMHKKIHHSKVDGTALPVEECKIYNAIKQGRGAYVNDEVFWRANGTSFDVEYRSYPQVINGKVVGGVITFNDITEKKKKDEEIRYLNCHDSLTGLYNRRCFEEALINIDTEDNLPISIIFSDINGLKMTNDIFGHKAGDELIKKSAEILKSSCRDIDIISRVGGDEFVILLARTNASDSQKIIKHIQSGLKSARVEAIKCSISLGSDTKTNKNQSLEVIMANAENAMYKDKTVNRHKVNKDIINTLIESLHSKVPDEKLHSIETSEMCEKIGFALNLSMAEIIKAKRAGYLHDIGKIIIDDSIEILNPPTIREEKMRPHTVTGYRILNLFDDTLDLAEYVYSHHERWDGTGYPRGLKEEQIPLISRIISIAECYTRWANLGERSINEKQTAIDIIMSPYFKTQN